MAAQCKQTNYNIDKKSSKDCQVRSIMNPVLKAAALILLVPFVAHADLPGKHPYYLGVGDFINPGGPLSQSTHLDCQRFEAKSWIPLAE